jgi:DNA repair exonuclease SbcCD ATPase subunit
MKISKLSISGFLKLDEYDVETGKVNVITAKNDRGKSSLLKAITAAFTDKVDVELIRHGHDKAEVGILFDNGYNATCTINEKGRTVKITDGNGHVVPKPGTWLKEKFPMFDVNPIELLQADEKKQLEYILKAVPLQVNKDALSKLLSDVKIRGKYDLTEHAIVLIDQIMKELADERLVHSRIKSNQEGAVNTLKSSLVMPEGDLKKSEALLDELEMKKMGLVKKNNQFLEMVDKEKYEKISKAKDEFQRKKTELYEQYQKAVDELSNELDKEIEAANEMRDKLTVENNESYSRALSEIISEIEKVNGDIQILRKSQNLVTQIEEEKKKLAETSAEWQHYDNAIKALRDYKTTLLDKLPIPGLEIKDGRIFYNGDAFQNLNTATQMELVVRIAKLRNDSGFMLVDGIERLDKGNQVRLLQIAEDSDLQFFVTRVDEIEDLKFEVMNTN